MHMSVWVALKRVELRVVWRKGELALRGMLVRVGQIYPESSNYFTTVSIASAMTRSNSTFSFRFLLSASGSIIALQFYSSSGSKKMP